MYAIARVEQLIEDDHEIALDVAVLRERLTADAETTNAGDLSSRSVEDVMAA
jgi:hypothetical protein